LALPGLIVSEFAVPLATTKFDLTLNVAENVKGRNVTLAFTYSTDLFVRSTIERLAGHFVQLVSAVAASAKTRNSVPLGELPMLTSAER
jgi:non-ribosomal peptide synthetase component F